MQIAITADVHLKRKDESPDRYRSLEFIIEDMKKKDLRELIIAGDLFDKEFAGNNYSEFENLCKDHSEISFYIIPGNHDPNLKGKFFTSGNIIIIEEACLREFGEMPVLFIPYDIEKPDMDSAIAEFKLNNQLPEKFILIGHGDYISANKSSNSYEEGFYMALNNMSVNKYNPKKVILGHIHKKNDNGRVFYPGSPCGLDITETGRKHYIVLDVESAEIEYKNIETDTIYLDAKFLMLPVDDEPALVAKNLDGIFEGLSDAEIRKTVLRLSITGYTNDLTILNRTVTGYCKEKGVRFYTDNGPDISGVKVLSVNDIEKIRIFEKAVKIIEDTEECTELKNGIIERSMELIFKERD
jgi:DNA repair protein SbcD/Mre11